MREPRRFMSWVAAAVLLLSGHTARAELRLPGLFSDHAVLQSGMEAPVWGWAEPGQEVAVQLGSHKVTAKADSAGKWMAKLPAMEASVKGQELVVSAGGERLQRGDVLVGEVWIGSGQSNMAMTVARSARSEEFIKEASRPEIRLFTVPRSPKEAPATDVNGKWVVCSPEAVKEFSAVLYQFGRNLQENLHVPVGLIHSSWGGTGIQLWTPDDGYASAEDLAAERAKFRSRLRPVSSRPAGSQKAAPPTAIARLQPTMLYNGMIAPLIPYAIRGVIWYQGENNVHSGEASVYAQRMAGMVRSWRQHWGQGDWAFLYVQIAPYGAYRAARTELPVLWEQQTKALSMIPHSGMAPIADLGDLTNIHPTNKHEVGRRLAAIALAETYAAKGIWHEGPMYASHRIEGDRVIVKFRGVDGGLVARDGKELTGFEIASADGQFVPAKAQIEGDEVAVRAEGVAKPAAVRFAWDEEAMPNLANKEGWPAVAFRTNAK